MHPYVLLPTANYMIVRENKLNHLRQNHLYSRYWRGQSGTHTRIQDTHIHAHRCRHTHHSAVADFCNDVNEQDEWLVLVLELMMLMMTMRAPVIYPSGEVALLSVMSVVGP